MYLYKFKIVVLLIIPFILGCSDRNDSVVAQFGNQKISFQEFQTVYLDLLKKPHSMDSEQLREFCLDEIITWKLLAFKASESGLDNDEKFQYKYNAYNNKVLRELHFQHQIKPQIRINDNELREVYSFITQQRHVKHLFFKSYEEADACYHRLKNGEDWNTIAREVIPDTDLATSGGDLGWINWDQMEYDMAMTTFRQELGTISRPVASSFGYHIIKVVDFKKDPLITEQNYQSARKKVRYILEKKIGDKIAAEYITSMMKDRHIEIQTEMVNLIASRFQEIFNRNPKQYEMTLEAQSTPGEIQELENKYWSNRNNILAVIDGDELTVGEFIYNLNYIPYSATASGFKTALNFVIRDRVLTKEAVELRLDHLYSEYCIKTELFQDKLLQIEYRKLLNQKITVGDEEIFNRYQKDRDRLYKNIVFDDVKDDIKNIIYTEKRSQFVSEHISVLKHDITIRKNMQIVHDYYNNIRNG